MNNTVANGVIGLAKQLVGIPSYLDGQTDESAIADYLEQFLAQQLPMLSVERQYLADSPRANLIVRGSGTPKLFVVGHIDTVQPNDGWRTDPVKPVVRAGSLYGLGAADMKGSLAALLTALCDPSLRSSLDGLMMLLYVDEEYNFAGVQRFLDSGLAQSLRPQMTLSLDGVMEVASGCRGLIELNLITVGKTGHASKPTNGINAIVQTMDALRELERQLAEFCDDSLGATTLNIAYIQGGVRQVSGADVVWRRAGNIIADTAEVTIEIRPSVATINATFAIKLLGSLMKTRGLTLQTADVTHDITPWLADYDKPELRQLQECYREAGVPFAQSDRKLSSYLDVQMLAEVIPSPTYVIGTGGANKHGANEYVPIANLRQTTKLYKSILKGFLKDD